MSENLRFLRKVKLFKKFTIGFILILDYLKIFPFVVPLINWAMRVTKIGRQWNSNLNYRYFSKSFANAFDSANKEEKTVVFFFAMGSESSSLLRQLILAKFLEKKTWNVKFVFCNGALEICHKERIGKNRNDTNLFCTECAWGYNHISKVTKLNIDYLDSYILSDEITNRINELNSVDDCENYCSNGGSPIGQLVNVNVLRYFYKGQLDNTPEELRIYKKFILATEKSVNSLNNYFSSNSVDLSILINGSGNFDQSVIFCSQKHKVPYITQEFFIGSNSWIYKKNGIAIHLDFIKEWEQSSKKNLNDLEKKELYNLFSNLKTGANLDVKLQGKDENVDHLTPGVVLFTNLNFDTYVLGRNNIFSSMNEWLLETIDFWKKNYKKLPLYIRIHPGESKMITATNTFTRDLLHGKAAENIIIIDSNSEINSYALLKKAKYVITYSSTIGVESMLLKIPCVSAGEPFYNYFSRSPKSKSNYFEILKNWNSEEFDWNINLEELESYLHFLYLKRTKQLKGYNVNRVRGIIELNELQQHQELIELNKKFLEEFYTDCIEE
jgi:hypothetical protein